MEKNRLSVKGKPKEETKNCTHEDNFHLGTEIARMSVDHQMTKNSLIESQNQLKEGRYFHGIVTFMSRPQKRQYFILDSKTGTLSIFNNLLQQKPTC